MLTKEQKVEKVTNRLIEALKDFVAISETPYYPAPTRLPIAPPNIKGYQMRAYQQLQRIHDEAVKKEDNYHPYFGYFSNSLAKNYISKIPKPTELYPVPIKYVNDKIQEWAEYHGGRNLTIDEAYREVYLVKHSALMSQSWAKGKTFEEVKRLPQYDNKKLDFTKKNYLNWSIKKQEEVKKADEEGTNKGLRFFENLQDTYAYFLKKAADVMFEQKLMEVTYKEELGEPPMELDEHQFYLGEEHEAAPFIFEELLKKNITSIDQFRIEDLEPFGFNVSGKPSMYTGVATTEKLLIELPVSRYEEVGIE